MTIAIVAGFCVLLLILAFLLPRLSRGPSVVGRRSRGAPTRSPTRRRASSATGSASRSAAVQKAIHKSGSTGRKGRDKMPF